MLVVLPAVINVDLLENIKCTTGDFALDSHCIKALDHIVPPCPQLINHFGYMCLRTSKSLHCCYLDRQICCYPHSCKLRYILAQSSKLFGAAVQADVATAPASHQIGL